jgi:3-hydroxyisobutyrate dehydrogenase
MTQIAFLGLGNMGKPMAVNLVKAGHALKVYDPVEAAMAELVEVGARGARSAREAVEGCSVVCSMLPASAHVEALYLGGVGVEGVLPHIERGSLVVDFSTIAAASARKVAAAAKARELDMLDAPVSGGTAAAASGALTFIVGGEPAVLERARPFLDVMGKNVFLAGPAGAGQVAKICNNMLLAVMMAGTSEALALGAENGLDPKVLSEIMSKSSGRNWAIETYNPWPGVMENAPSSREYAGGFASDLMLKDLGLAAEAAIEHRRATPLGDLARSLYALHVASGNGRLDFSSIARLFGANAGAKR